MTTAVWLHLELLQQFPPTAARLTSPTLEQSPALPLDLLSLALAAAASRVSSGQLAARLPRVAAVPGRSLARTPTPEAPRSTPARSLPPILPAARLDRHRPSPLTRAARFSSARVIKSTIARP